MNVPCSHCHGSGTRFVIFKCRPCNGWGSIHRRLPRLPGPTKDPIAKAVRELLADTKQPPPSSYSRQRP